MTFTRNISSAIKDLFQKGQRYENGRCGMLYKYLERYATQVCGKDPHSYRIPK